MTTLPTGTVTFLFTDIQGSTRMLADLGDRYYTLLEQHHAIMRKVLTAAGGIDVATEGDAFFVVFASAPAAVAGSADAQRALAAHDWGEGVQVRVRMGLHTGEGILAADNYVGMDVHRAARIASAGHGGQVLMSEATYALVASSLPEGVGVRELGSHRLKDIPEPERIHQLVVEGLPDTYPPLRTLESRPNNLRPHLTPFIGRETEVRAAIDLLGASRLLTLTGPGGTGKTRLSLEVAASVLEDYDDGVFFVALAPIVDPQLVAPTIAQTLGLHESGGKEPQALLEDFLRDRRMLLVLDNFEQVVDTGPVIPELLHAAPDLKVLVSSRQTLRVSGEQEYQVPPLDLPDPEHLPPLDRLASNDAVALFLQRAMAVRPDFRLTDHNAQSIVAICARLDGLPLAIELAASRVRLLSPEAIFKRLQECLTVLTGGGRDLPARQQTLRDAIGWSYDLLGGAERTLLRRLSVFAGGWTIEAADQVCNPDLELGADTFDLLESLVDKSLVRLSDGADPEPRFRMLQTIREYAQELLAGSEEQNTIRDRHLHLYSKLVSDIGRLVTGTDGVARMETLGVEHDNIRGAFAHALETDAGPLGLRMGFALWRFWHLRGHLSEGRRVMTALLALPSARTADAERARGLEALGSVVYWQNDYEAARTCYAESLAILRDLDDRQGVADMLTNLTYIAGIVGEYDWGESMSNEALEVYWELGDERGVADAITGLGLMASLKDEHEKVLRYYEEAKSIFERLGLRWNAVNTQVALPRVYLDLGDPARARELYRDALPAVLELGDMSMLSFVLDDFAEIVLAEGNPARAARIAGASERIRETLGGGAPPALIKRKNHRELVGDLLPPEVVETEWELGKKMTVEEVVDLVWLTDPEVEPDSPGRRFDSGHTG